MLSGPLYSFNRSSASGFPDSRKQLLRNCLGGRKTYFIPRFQISRVSRPFWVKGARNGRASSVNPPIDQSIETNQSVNQNQPTHQPLNQACNRSINQSANQSINQSRSHSIKQSVNQPNNQSIDQSTVWTSLHRIDSCRNRPTVDMSAGVWIDPHAVTSVG